MASNLVFHVLLGNFLGRGMYPKLLIMGNIQLIGIFRSIKYMKLTHLRGRTHSFINTRGRRGSQLQKITFCVPFFFLFFPYSFESDSLLCTLRRPNCKLGVSINCQRLEDSNKLILPHGAKRGRGGGNGSEPQPLGL